MLNQQQTQVLKHTQAGQTHITAVGFLKHITAPGQSFVTHFQNIKHTNAFQRFHNKQHAKRYSCLIGWTAALQVIFLHTSGIFQL